MKTNAIAFIAVFSLFPSLSFATLGEPGKSIKKVSKVLKSQDQVSKRQKTLSNGQTVFWDIHEIKTQGYTVKEFVSPEGSVFAVSWQGVQQPDLKLLLGSHYQEYKNADKKQPVEKGQRVKTVESDRLLAHQSGVLRNRKGQVLVKALVPDGIGTEDIE